jgi:hypothetical protein
MEEWDGEGELFHYGRRGRPGEQEQYLAALGYDADGGKDLRAEIVSEILAERVTSAIRKDRVMMARLSALLRSQTYRPAPWSVVLERIKDAIHREGWEFAMDYIADWFCGVPYFVRLADEWKDALAPLEGMLMQADAVAAWMTALERGLIGNPLAVSFDIYEHGGIAYSVSGEGMQCRWDTSRGGAIWVPCEIAEDNIRTTVLGKMGIGTVKWSGALGSAENPLHAQYSLDGGVTWQGHFQKWREAVDAMLQASERQIEPAEMLSAMQAAAEEYCRGVLETYNQFCNGDVYGYTVSVIDRETGEEVDGEGDSLWGIFGMDCAEEELDSAMLAVAGRMLESKTSTTY